MRIIQNAAQTLFAPLLRNKRQISIGSLWTDARIPLEGWQKLRTFQKQGTLFTGENWARQGLLYLVRGVINIDFTSQSRENRKNMFDWHSVPENRSYC